MFGNLFKAIVDLVIDGVDVSGGLNSSHEVSLSGFVSELCNPFLETAFSLIECYPSVNETSSALAFFIDWLNDFAKWRPFSRRAVILNMIHDLALTVDPSSQSSSKAFLSGAVEPDDGIDSTWNEGLWWRRFGCWLDQKLRSLGLNLSLSGIQISRHLVT